MAATGSKLSIFCLFIHHTLLVQPLHSRVPAGLPRRTLGFFAVFPAPQKTNVATNFQCATFLRFFQSRFGGKNALREKEPASRYSRSANRRYPTSYREWDLVRDRSEVARVRMDAQKTILYISTSWDDGHPLDLRLAELLDKYGLPATFYLPLVSNRPLLTHSQILEISKKYEIGAHTITHCDLSRVDDGVAREEIAGCKKRLEQIVGAPCTAFCFPWGRFRRKHIKLVLEAGYQTARTVELMSTQAPCVRDGVAILATTVQAVPPTFGLYERNTLKRLRVANLLRSLRYGTSDWVKTTEAVLTHLFKNGGVFHLWGHSWEINERAQWPNVERAFALLAQFKQSAVFLRNGQFASLSDLSKPIPITLPLSKSTDLRRLSR